MKTAHESNKFYSEVERDPGQLYTVGVSARKCGRHKKPIMQDRSDFSFLLSAEADWNIFLGQESETMESTASSDRDYFNARANEWDQTCVHDQDKVAHIVNLMGIGSSDRILDVGTGTGVLIPHLMEHLDDGHITAVDVSEKMLEVAQRKYKGGNITYLHGDVLQMTFAEKFDLIICYSMFPHFKEHKMKAIQMLSQLLKSGGKLCICHSQSRAAINQLHRRAGDVVEKDRLPKMTVLKEAFLDQGLSLQCVRDDKEYFIISGKRIL